MNVNDRVKIKETCLDLGIRPPYINKVGKIVKVYPTIWRGTMRIMAHVETKTSTFIIPLEDKYLEELK